MKKKIIFIIGMILVVGVAISIFLYSSDSDKKNISRTFTDYQSAILNKNGLYAVDYLSKDTFDYYSALLQATKNASKSEVLNMRIGDRFTILMLRHSFEPSMILGLKDGKDLVTFSIDHGLIGADGAARVSIHSIKTYDNTAFVEVKTDDGVSPFKYQFKKEDGLWKMDLASVMPEVSALLEHTVSISNMTESEFILSVLQDQTGINPTEKIWDPLVR